MIEKTEWTDDEFENMGWHDCTIYGIGFQSHNYQLIFDIDYIFKWEQQGESYHYWIAPCTLTFENCSKTNIGLDFGQTNQLIISDITRGEELLAPNGKVHLRLYQIATDVGSIEFYSTGYKQTIRGSLKHSESQDYGFAERDGITLKTNI